MKPPLFIFYLALAGWLCGQESLTPPATSQPARRVVSQSVVRQPDGGSITFQRVEAPAVLPLRPKLPVVLTPEELATQVRRGSKAPVLLSISASVQENGMTLLRWSADGHDRLQALSNVDFRLLAGTGSVETETKVHLLVMAVGTDTGVLDEKLAVQAQLLPAAGTPSFVLLEGKTAVSAQEQQAVAAMEALHDYFEANREILTQRHAQREAEQAARELATRNAPPPGPKHTVIQFWPLQPEQRAAIRNSAQRQSSEAAQTGIAAPQSEGGEK